MGLLGPRRPQPPAAATQDAAHVPWCLPPAAWADLAPLQTARGGSCRRRCVPGICHGPTGGQRGGLRRSLWRAPPPPPLPSSIYRLKGIHCLPQAAQPLSMGLASPSLGVNMGTALEKPGETDRPRATPNSATQCCVTLDKSPHLSEPPKPSLLKWQV